MHLLASLLPLAALALAWSDPLPCTGICTNSHDPSMLQRSSDGTFYRFSTGGDMAIHYADSLQGPWVYDGSIRSGGEDSWAPDVHQLADGTYVCYYSVSEFGTQNSWIGVATSDSLAAGTWTDHGATGLSSQEGDNYNAIDANLFQTGDGNLMNFGSFWGDLFQTPWSDDGLTDVGGSPVQIQFNSSGTQAAEAAYLFQHDDYYYLFWSAGVCCNYVTSMPAPGEEYSIRVCRADSPTGPFVDAEGNACTESGGTMVLGSHGNVYGPGGQGVLGNTPLGDVLYYHHVDTTISYNDGDKLLGVNVIDWSSGWPVV